MRPRNSRYMASKGGRSGSTAGSWYGRGPRLRQRPDAAACNGAHAWAPVLDRGPAAKGGSDLLGAVGEDGVGLDVAAPRDPGLVVDRPDGDSAARVVDLLDDLRIRSPPVRRVNIGRGVAQQPGGVDRPRALEDAELEGWLHLAQPVDGGVVEGDDRALRDGAQLAEHVDELLLQAGIERRQLLDLDHEADLADRELDHLLQEGDLLPVAGVELAQLGRGVVADEPRAVG